MNFFKFFQNILISSAFLSVIFLVNSCASTKIAPYANEVHSSFSGDDAVSLGKTQESRKSYFSRIDESIMKDVENALPASLKRAASSIRKSENELSEQERVLLLVISNMMKILWPDERIDWESPSNVPETSYIAAIKSSKEGLYDTSTGNVDFLSSVLPSLVVLKVSDVSDFYAKAQSDLKFALSLNSDSFLVYYLLGILDFKKGNYEQSLLNLEKAKDFSKDIPSVIEYYVSALKLSGKVRESYKVALENLEKFPNNICLLKICAENAFEMQLYEQAEDYIAKVLMQNPSDLDSLLFRAKVLIKSNNYIRAISLLDTYALQDEEKKEYLILRSLVQYEWSKNVSASVSTIEKAIKLYPDDSDVLLFAAKLSDDSFVLVNGKSSDFYAEKILSVQPENTDALKYAVNSYIRKKEFEKAYGLSKKLVSLSPEDSGNVLSFCNILIELKKVDEAYQFILPIYRQKMQDENIVQAYISVLVASNRTQEASSIISSLLPSASVKMKSFLYYKKSFLENSVENSLADLRSSLISNPRNIDSLFRLYEIYFQKKDYRKAQYYLKQIVALNPNASEYKKLNDELSTFIK